jgi:hypothetical protein
LSNVERSSQFAEQAIVYRRFEGALHDVISAHLLGHPAVHALLQMEFSEPLSGTDRTPYQGSA